MTDPKDVVQPLEDSQTPLVAIEELSSLRGVNAFRDATIMLVDDEPTTIDIIEMCLQDAGYSNFVKTTDPTQVIALMRWEQPDMLLLDLNMPEVGGFEILEQIRSDPELQYTPVVILTSSVDAETKLKALELGATDFLGKPADPSELALRLRNTLAAKAYQDRLNYYDALTGLPNRKLMMERLRRGLKRANHDARDCAVLHIDLDRFKQINDTLGRQIGDDLLKTVADRLERNIRPTDAIGGSQPQGNGGMLARVGSDEFVLFLPWADSVENASRAARRIIASFEKPIELAGHELFVTCSIGVALCPGDGDDIETLMRNADIAMSEAKQQGRNNYQFYSESMNVQSLERLGLETQLRGALARREITLHYQPKIDVRTGRIMGSEALMRWRHPEMGPISPGRFIPVAEETGLIIPLGEWALATALRQTRAWHDSSHRPLRVSVNVASPQFRSGNLPDLVRNCLQRSFLDAKYLVLELTESMLMENPEQAVSVLQEVKSMGVKLSVDDFGTGYSSLSYLKRFPLDELKVDQSFVKGIPHDADDCAIVTATIAMAHGLGLTVVAEGVETVEQLAFLAGRGCDEYQGYLFSAPKAPRDWREIFEKEIEDAQ